MLKGAMIGFGKIAQTSHMKAFLEPSIKSRAEITSAVEPDRKNRELSAQKYPWIKFYSSVDELFENERVDFVDIVSPPSSHIGHIDRALSAGCNIICEKPFVIGYENAAMMADKLEKSGVVFLPCHQYRYSPLWKEFKRFMDRIHDSVYTLIQFDVYRTDADFGLPVLEEPWRVKKGTSGGGILADTGVHYLYLSRWLGGVPKSLVAMTANLYHKDYEVEDTAFVALELERALVEITLTWSANRRYNSARLTSHEGSLEYRGGTTLIVNIGDGQENIEVPDVSDKSHYLYMYESLFNEFLDRIEHNSESTDVINEALETVKLLDCCYVSSAERKVVQL
jgi:predicted dehydrogenase